jgi:tetratricopeptide (TPR) repeat protein
VYFMRARLRDLAGDKAGAKRDFDLGMKSEPGDEKGWVARGVARINTDPAGALADFEAALALNPRSHSALQNRAHVLGKQGKTADAVRSLDRLLEFYPDSVMGRAGRGVLHARLGNAAAALADARGALERDTAAAYQFQVGSIYALLAKHDPGHKAEAIRLLSAALRAGFGFDLIETDKDLDPIRDTPEFKRVLDGARSLRAGASH